MAELPHPHLTRLAKAERIRTRLRLPRRFRIPQPVVDPGQNGPGLRRSRRTFRRGGEVGQAVLDVAEAEVGDATLEIGSGVEGGTLNDVVECVLAFLEAPAVDVADGEGQAGLG